MQNKQTRKITKNQDKYFYIFVYIKTSKNQHVIVKSFKETFEHL